MSRQMARRTRDVRIRVSLSVAAYAAFLAVVLVSAYLAILSIGGYVATHHP